MDLACEALLGVLQRTQTAWPRAGANAVDVVLAIFVAFFKKSWSLMIMGMYQGTGRWCECWRGSWVLLTVAPALFSP